MKQLAQTESTSKKQQTTLPELSDNEIGLYVPKEKGKGLTLVKFDSPTALAHKETDLIIALYGLLCKVSGQDKQDRGKMQLMRLAMKRKKVTVEEVIEGFWGAYSDPYVKDGDIHWRHIWKHIEKLREAQPATYTRPGKVRPGT